MAPISESDLSAAAATLAQDNSAFALDLYRRLAQTRGNLFFSPWSISSAFGMAQAGARQRTADQMAEALHFTLEPELLHPAFARLDSMLEQVQAAGNVTLNSANSLWPQKDYPFLESYLELIAHYYGTEISAVDYKSDREAARGLINRWVEAKTNDKIKDLLQPGVLSAMTRLVLVNAIYFMGNWESPFDPDHTYDAPFYSGSSKSAKVPMMSQTEVFSYADLDSLQLLQLPYRGDELSLLVLLPQERNGLARLERGLTASHLAEWRSRLVQQKVAVHLPRFKLTSEFQLGNTLRAMGMTDAFDPAAADFSGMDGQPGWLYIGAAIHKAFVDVNEVGTEAAAATALVMVATSMPNWPTFRADHPFIFLIQDNRTGSLLFVGRLVEQTGGEE
ncbi:MAG: serpin family protein [Candidatus Delongbacteria bacterium]|nr:serpin family protein [Candidatus Delongbacteria bacterium]